MKRTSAVVGILAFIFIVCSGVPTVYAWFTDTDSVQNCFSIGKNDVEIEENFPSNKIYPWEVATKEVVFTNTGTVSCYVRGRYYFSLLTAEENLNLILGSELWKKNSDGYYYYQKELAPGESTESFILGLEFKDEGSLSRSFDLDIYTETVQSEGSTSAEEAFLDLLC